MWIALVAFIFTTAPPSPTRPVEASPDAPRPAKAYLISMARLPAPERYDPTDGLVSYPTGFPKRIEHDTFPSLRVDGPLRVAGACLPDDARRLAPFLRPASVRFELIPIDEWPEAELPCPKVRAGWRVQMDLDTSNGEHTIEGTWFERSREEEPKGLMADWSLVVVRRNTRGKPVSAQVVTGREVERILSFTADDSGLVVEQVVFAKQCFLGERGRLVERKVTYPIPPEGPRMIVHWQRPLHEVDCPKSAMKRPTEEEQARDKAMDDHARRMLELLQKHRSTPRDGGRR